MPNRRRGSAVAALVVGVGLAASACVGTNATSSQPGGRGYLTAAANITVVAPSARSLAPAVTGTTLTGRPFALTAYRGSVVVLNFWASWCPPCRDEAPGLQGISVDLAPLGVRVVGVNERDSQADALAFLAVHHLTYPSVADEDGGVLLSFDALPPTDLPSTLVIDRHGRIAARAIGEVTYSQLAPVVRAIAAERA